MNATPPYRALLIIGLLGLLPILVITLMTNEHNMYTNAMQVGQMVGAYFAFFSFLLLIDSLAYYIKARNGGICSQKLNKWHIILSLLAFAFFAAGALVLPQIGQRLMGGFVALSLFSFFIGQIVFLVNLAKRNQG